MQQIAMLKEEDATELGQDVETAVHVVGMECCGAALEGVCFVGFVEVEVEGVEGEFEAGGGDVGAVLVGCFFWFFVCSVSFSVSCVIKLKGWVKARRRREDEKKGGGGLVAYVESTVLVRT